MVTRVEQIQDRIHDKGEPRSGHVSDRSVVQINKCPDTTTGEKSEFNYPKIAILLASYRGEKFLAQQLDSLYLQRVSNWKIWVSDDGSDDGTCDILGQYASKWGSSRISVASGPGQGYVANFLYLVCNPEISADYYAFCDQDDIWQPDKLSRALDWLESVPATVPALYCSRTRLIDEVGKEIGYSPLYKRPPGFSNALVQNIAGGNTMVFNQAARNLLLRAGGGVEVVYHDWLTYLLVTGAGGKVFYDADPTILYRQHSTNMIGSTVNLYTRVFRLRLLLNGRFRQWCDLNLEALETVQDILTPENQQVLHYFNKSRNCPFFKRIHGMFKSGVHRQTLLGNVGLAAATLLGKL